MRLREGNTIDHNTGAIVGLIKTIAPERGRVLTIIAKEMMKNIITNLESTKIIGVNKKLIAQGLSIKNIITRLLIESVNIVKIATNRRELTLGIRANNTINSIKDPENILRIDKRNQIMITKRSIDHHINLIVIAKETKDIKRSKKVIKWKLVKHLLKLGSNIATCHFLHRF